MKTNKVIAALILGLSIAACSPKDAATSPEAKALMPSKAQIDSVSYLLGINFGSFMKSYNFGENINYAEVVKGMKEFVAAKGDYRDEDFTKQFKIDPNTMNDVFNNFLEKRQQLTLLQNKEKSDNFLAENAKKDGIVTTESGLQYKIIEEGNEVRAAATDTVTVRYKGTLIDGTVFDQVADDADPISLTLNRVIPGWTEGLQLIGEGGKIQLFIPSDLGYGEQGSGTIEPNSALIFDVELTKIGKVAAAE